MIDVAANLPARRVGNGEDAVAHPTLLDGAKALKEARRALERGKQSAEQ